MEGGWGAANNVSRELLLKLLRNSDINVLLSGTMPRIKQKKTCREKKKIEKSWLSYIFRMSLSAWKQSLECFWGTSVHVV